MTFGSLFAGIGGFDLGLERAGMTCKWQVEIDPFCRAVLAKHWPDVRRYEDVRTLYWGNVELVDVICGGFPCQPVALVGRRRAQRDARWLWPHFKDAICILRPRYVVVENVPGLRSWGLDEVLGDLASLGFDAEWESIPASAVGAPHIRDRVWIVAYPSSVQLRHQSPARFVGARYSHQGTLQEQTPVLADPDRLARWEQQQLQISAGAQARDEPRGSCEWAVEPKVGRVVHGLSGRMDRNSALGNSIVPQIAEWLGRRILEADAANQGDF